MMTMRSLGDLDTTVFFSCSMHSINLCFCMLLKNGVFQGLQLLKGSPFCVSDKTPDYMENGETGRYLVYTDGAISALRISIVEMIS